MATVIVEYDGRENRVIDAGTGEVLYKIRPDVRWGMTDAACNRAQDAADQGVIDYLNSLGHNILKTRHIGMGLWQDAEGNFHPDDG